MKEDKKHAIKFAHWIHNNWYRPSEEHVVPLKWVLKKSQSDLLSEDQYFTVEELYDKFIKTNPSL